MGDIYLRVVGCGGGKLGFERVDVGEKGVGGSNASELEEPAVDDVLGLSCVVADDDEVGESLGVVGVHLESGGEDGKGLVKVSLEHACGCDAVEELCRGGVLVDKVLKGVVGILDGLCAPPAGQPDPRAGELGQRVVLLQRSHGLDLFGSIPGLVETQIQLDHVAMGSSSRTGSSSV